MRKLKSLHRKLNPSVIRILLVAFSVGAVGAALIVTSRAATPAATIESENGTAQTPAVKISDSSASVGKAVRFTATGASGNSCPAYPSFPDASCTGVPEGVSLTAYTGPDTITTNNTVIDGKIFSGGVYIYASGVVIKNSIINGTVYVDDAANYARSNNGSSPVVTIEDSLIDCHGTMGSTGVIEAHYAIKRVEIVRCENGLDMNQNILVEDSYIHNLGDAGSDPHSDGAQCASGRWNGSTYIDGAKNLTLRHNTIYGMSQNDTKFETSAIICGSGTGGGIVVDKNLLAGGAYTLYCVRGGPAIGFTVTDNHFSTMFKSSVGAYGPSDGCHDEIISGNIYHETGIAIDFANDD